MIWRAKKKHGFHVMYYSLREEVSAAVYTKLHEILDNPTINIHETHTFDELTTMSHCTPDDIDDDINFILIPDIEEMFHIKVTQQDLNHIHTVKDIIDLIVHLCEKRGEHNHYKRKKKLPFLMKVILIFNIFMLLIYIFIKYK